MVVYVCVFVHVFEYCCVCDLLLCQCVDGCVDVCAGFLSLSLSLSLSPPYPPLSLSPSCPRTLDSLTARAPSILTQFKGILYTHTHATS